MWKFVKAQLGPKPGARAVLATLIDCDDLPGDGWRRTDERSWRTGAVGSPTPWGDRARAAGSITGWRSFASGSRWLWVQVTPFTSEDDAKQALTDIPARMMANASAEVTVVAERDVETAEFVGASAVWAREQDTTGGVCRYLAGVVGASVVMLAASGSGWTWPTVSDLAARQANQSRHRAPTDM